MDVKAMAKSKRAHSQHHSKKPHNPNQKLKPQSPSPSNDAVGASKKQVKEKTRQSPGLPSNWNRYEEEEELESGSQGMSLSHAEADVILPKSKGADFRYLLSEAQSQANTALALDDVLPGEFNAGLSSMLEVRGESFLSWIGDENFVVEDMTIGTHEASFLSLNLHALAENLEKINLSKRLFIEPDLLPPELCAECPTTVGNNEEPYKLQSTEDSELVNRMSEQLLLDDIGSDLKTADQFPSSSHGNSNTTSAFTLSNDILLPVNNVDIKFTQHGNSDENKANLLSTEDTKTTFEVASAEDELDILLDSFGDTKNLDSPGFRSNSSLPVSHGVTSVASPAISNKEAVSSKTASIAANLDDDALDELLEETSTLSNQNALLRPQEDKNVLHSMQSGTKSKVADDFDSWFDTL